MNSNERIDEFLKLQDKGTSLEEIAFILGVKPQTLRKDLNKNGYKSVKGKYIKKQNDLKQKNNSVQVKFEDTNLIEKTTRKKNKVAKPKKDRKINLTQEDLDKLCEVYDWCLEVKDLKSLKRKKNKKDIVIDFEPTGDKNVSLKIDKGVWEDFLRLCSNSGYDRKTIVTQALKDFMNVHKDLL